MRLGGAGPECLLITGMPGAGKSTISGLVSERTVRCACIDGDFVNGLVRNGRVWALGAPAEEATRQVELGNRNLCSLAKNFVAAEFSAVLDWIVPDLRQLEQLVNLLDRLPLRVVVLSPGSAVCRRRNRDRDPVPRFDFDGYDQLHSTMREFADRAWWLDSSTMSADATARAIIADVHERAPVLTS